MSRNYDLPFLWSKFELILFAAEQMDQISILSGLGSDITDESTSLVDVRWSSDEDEVKKKKKKERKKNN